METEKIVEILKQHLGQNLKAQWRRNLKTRQGIGVKVEKVTEAIVRSGLEYDARLIVQMKREIGELPAENAGLNFGEWIVPKLVIRHRDMDYIRVYPSSIHTKPKIKYLVNGEEVEKSQVKNLCLSIELKDDDEPLCFTVKSKDFESIG